MKRGSALLMALWIILSLSVIVMSFAFEAKLHGGINMYVESKNRVKRLIDAGVIIGEVVLAGYDDSSIEDPSKNLDLSDAAKADKLKEDRWYFEKQALKYSGRNAVIGPILLDDENPDSGTIKVEIGPGGGDGINVNCLYKEEDANFEDRWHIILDLVGVPRDDVEDEDGKSVSLQNYIIACWQDYRDEDDVRYDISESAAFGAAQGAEKAEYEEYYDDHKKDIAEEDRHAPVNGEIQSIEELARLLCFRRFPQYLIGNGGLVKSGILGTTGDGKVNVNTATREQLMTVPGIYDTDEIDENEKSETGDLAKAIVDTRKIQPKAYDVPLEGEYMEHGWGYGEFNGGDWWEDLVQRLSDEGYEISNDAKNYLRAQPAQDSTFTMKITVSIMGVEYTAGGNCYVKDKKVRFISWKEPYYDEDRR